MNKYQITATVISTALLASCASYAKVDLKSGMETPVPAATPSGSASEPTLGYIVYSGRSQGKQNIYRQDMIGMVPSGAPVAIYEETTGINNRAEDARYPQVTSDGRYIVFITRETTGVGASPADELVIMDHQGVEWFRAPHPQSNHCFNLNYPEIITYEYDTDFSQTNFEIITMCADQWPPTTMRAFHIGPSGNYFQTDGQLDQMPVGEYALLPGYTAANGGYIFAAQGDQLVFTKFEHNQPGPDKKATGQVHINSASRYDGGICSLNLSDPCPVDLPPKLKNVFAPSISPDGKYVGFNSEVYTGNAGVGEEFFVLDLPTTDLLDAYTPSWGMPIDLGYLSQIDDMDHANNQDNHYGTFTVNGLHQYTLHGDGDLQVAPDLTSAPTLIPSPNIEVWETGWFYKD